MYIEVAVFETSSHRPKLKHSLRSLNFIFTSFKDSRKNLWKLAKQSYQVRGATQDVKLANETERN